MLKDYYAEKYLELIPYVESVWICWNEELIRQYSNRQLEVILNREDVGLNDIRKKLFFDKKTSDDIKCAAIHFHFYPTYEEFYEILTKYTRKKPLKNRTYFMQLPGDVGGASTTLSLCMYQAILDLMEDKNNRDDEWHYVDTSKIKYFMQNKLKSINTAQQEREIRDLRLYNFASIVCKESNYPDGYPYDEATVFLQKHVVPEDSWKTFMAFVSVWNKCSDDELKKRNLWLEEENPSYLEFPEEKSELAILKDEVKKINEKMNYLTEIINVENVMHFCKWLFFGILIIVMKLNGSGAFSIIATVIALNWFSKASSQKWLEDKIEKTPRLLKILVMIIFIIIGIFQMLLN